MKKFSVAMFAVIVVAAIPALAATNYFQGFETDTADWDVTRVQTRTHGVTSAAGHFHALVPQELVPQDGSSFTRFGGYESTFPRGGYTTAIDVYLDVDGPYSNDTRFDWSSAISQPDVTQHRRDFIYTVGFYNDTDETGTGNRFVISASNNSPGDPKNGRDPLVITASGWYTFEHRFSKVAGNVLECEMRLTNLDGVKLASWTLSDPSDIVGVTVGGHRYGWFATQGFPELAIDNASLLSVALAGNVTACKNDGWQGFMRADGSIFTNQGDCINYVNKVK